MRKIFFLIVMTFMCLNGKSQTVGLSLTDIKTPPQYLYSILQKNGNVSTEKTEGMERGLFFTTC